MDKLDIRPSPIAGQWYPGSAQTLSRNVNDYLLHGYTELPPGKVVAVIAPHAGHRYSGPVAGFAFSPLRGQSFELVAVISPMHYAYSYPFMTTAHSAYETPLGIVPVDLDSLQKLGDVFEAKSGHKLYPVRQDPEHSLEIELPFLQVSLSDPFHLLPVMVREIHPEPLQALGLALAEILHGRNALLVASSDLSHFYTQTQARLYDQEMMKRIASFDPLAVLQAEEEGKGFACGRSAIAAVMWAARALGANHAISLHYATSGDVTGDYSRVVGYGAAVLMASPS